MAKPGFKPKQFGFKAQILQYYNTQNTEFLTAPFPPESSPGSPKGHFKVYSIFFFSRLMLFVCRRQCTTAKATEDPSKDPVSPPLCLAPCVPLISSFPLFDRFCVSRASNIFKKLTHTTSRNKIFLQKAWQSVCLLEYGHTLHYIFHFFKIVINKT